MNIIRLIIFTAIIPGLVIGYVPHSISGNYGFFNIGIFNIFGLIPIILGVSLYVGSTMSFLLKGKGTPAIWFAKHLKFLIGEEPIRMVSSGLYKISRNPMYLGVLSIAFGQAIFFESKSILIYAGLLTVFFHLTIVLLEEPHLRKKYGHEYERYLQRVRRWVGKKAYKL